MRVVSLIFGILAALGLLLGLLPLFGWLNWIFVLPPAVLGLIFGSMSRDRGGDHPERSGGRAGSAAADAGRRRDLTKQSIHPGQACLKGNPGFHIAVLLKQM